MTRIKQRLAFLLDPERDIQVIDIVNGLLVTEERLRARRTKHQVWKEVKP